MNRMGFSLVMIFFGVWVTAVWAEDLSVPSAKESSGKKSSDRHLYLYHKDPATWRVVENGAWGKLTFNESTSKFVLDAYGLMPHVEYALIRATGPKPYAHVVARGDADQKGYLHLSGSWPKWTLRFWVVKGKDVQGEAGDFGPGSLDPFEAWKPRSFRGLEPKGIFVRVRSALNHVFIVSLILPLQRHRSSYQGTFLRFSKIPHKIRDLGTNYAHTGRRIH